MKRRPAITSVIILHLIFTPLLFFPFCTERPPFAVHGTHPNSFAPKALADGQIVLGSFAVAAQCPGFSLSSLL